jgi:hypothetical protein
MALTACMGMGDEEIMKHAWQTTSFRRIVQLKFDGTIVPLL